MEMTKEKFLAQIKKNSAGNYGSRRFIEKRLQHSFAETLNYCSSTLGKDHETHAAYLISLGSIGSNLMISPARFIVKEALQEAFADAMDASQSLAGKPQADYLTAMGLIGGILIKHDGIRERNIT